MARNHRTVKTVSLICAHCKHAFICLAKDYRRRGRLFCGKACYWQARTTPFSVRFWGYVSKTGTCWLWQGTTTSGYGVFTVSFQGARRPKSFPAHRLSWEIHNGPIPEGLNVCHKCDVRNCVRPDHLFLGTDQDNMDDMTRKGRSMFGARNVNAKLTDDKVREIRRRYAIRKRGDVIAMQREFGIDRTAIHQIVRRQTWKHVQ